MNEIVPEAREEVKKELVKVSGELKIETKNIEVGEWGLNFKGQLSIEEWLDVALNIQKFDGKIQWYLGDLAVFAESDVTGWDKKREDGKSKYDDMIAKTGYGKDTLSVYARVSRRFPTVFRETILEESNSNSIISFAHFQLVMPLDDNYAAYYLRKAAENRWGVARLREEIRRWREGRGEIPEKEEKSIGELSFDDIKKEFFRGFSPMLSKEEYDRKSWLLEVRDEIDKELEQLGVING